MNKKKLLLVDDERDFINTMAERLAFRGFDPVVAYTGQDALALCQNETFDCVILDLRMPEMDGIEVLGRLRELFPTLRVIILTGHGHNKEREECMRLGAFEYRNKPVEMGVLLEILNAATCGPNI
ncbi:response regulator [Desulfovibrio inopinatus]|uniref:response regulator n=1 Tax=Desulfovibrio inopinatus TaxID=102109 RepID=UPI000419B50F|nr:response regulator [Desulfovibrio inopinatus]